MVNLMIEPLAKSMTDPKTDSMTNPMVDDTLVFRCGTYEADTLDKVESSLSASFSLRELSKKQLIISYNCIGLPCKAEMIKIMTLIIILQTNSVTTTITQGQ